MAQQLHSRCCEHCFLLLTSSFATSSALKGPAPSPGDGQAFRFVTSLTGEQRNEVGGREEPGSLDENIKPREK